MAECSLEGVEPNVIAVWTFVIKGGEPFSLKLNEKVGPPLNHDGLMTMWKMVGTEEEANAVQDMVRGPLIGATAIRYTEVETPEMLAIRHERLGRSTEE